jgi:putative transposase
VVEKKLPFSTDAKRPLIEPEHACLSIRRQCEFVGLHRSTYYLEAASETEENLLFMRLIDEQYLKTPFYGSRRMGEQLCGLSYEVNRKRIQRLMRKMGLEAIYPKSKTSQRGATHKVYPYVLRDVEIMRPNQVWSTDITYVPMPQGLMCLVAVLDWFSRFVLSCQLSNTLDGAFCLEALEAALLLGTPEIFNTDQGGHLPPRGLPPVWKPPALA